MAWLRGAILAGIAGGLLWLLYLLGAHGIADAARKLAQLHIAAAETQRQVPDADRLQLVQQLLDVARRLDPHHPQWLAQQGRVLEWQAHQAALQGAYGEQGDYRERALALYRQGVVARPSWPWAWLDLAWAKYRMGAFDAEFQHAVHQVVVTAPWQARVQLSLAELGVLSWSSLSPPNRRAVADGLWRLGAHAPGALVRLAAEPGYRVVICAFAATASQGMSRACDVR